MSWFSFKKTSKTCLGVDIGSSAIRIVELALRGQTFELTNYGEIKTSSLEKARFRTIEENGLLFSNKEVSRAISAIIKEAGIQTNVANFSVPDFSTFLTTIELPPMTKEELPQAIRYEARSCIPIPFSEVTIDYEIIEGDFSNQSKKPLKILVIAIPNDIVNQYKEIATLANLEAKVLEAEVIALVRATVKNKFAATTEAIIDIGARSTSCNILEKGILKSSHTFNISGNDFTERLSKALSVKYETAEELKMDFGLIETEESERNIREILLPLVDGLLTEVKKIFYNFYQEEGKMVEKITLAGGTALMPGLKDYFAKEFKKETVIAFPFEGFVYPQILGELLKEMGPTYTIAVGMAMKGFL